MNHSPDCPGVMLHQWYRFVNDTLHIRRTCPVCGFYDFAKQTPEAKALADQNPAYIPPVYERPAAAETPGLFDELGLT